MKLKYRLPFIKHLRHECKRYGMKLTLINKSGFADENDYYGGYFTNEPLEIAVATRVNYKDVIASLVHEFSHFEQWRDESPYYIKGYKGLNSDDIFSRWLNGEDFKKSTIRECAAIIRDCELDCERRAVANIRKYDVPLCIKDYCKRASADIHLYNFVIWGRRWNYDRFPNEIESIVSIMPENLDGDYSKMSKEMKDLYKKHLH